jgi:hypothetical protein
MDPLRTYLSIVISINDCFSTVACLFRPENVSVPMGDVYTHEHDLGLGHMYGSRQITSDTQFF